MTNEFFHRAWLDNGHGDRLKLELHNKGDELLGTVFIDK